MQITAALLFLAWTATAQNPPSGTATGPGCGADNIKFAVSTQGQHPVSRPEARKALVTSSRTTAISSLHALGARRNLGGRDTCEFIFLCRHRPGEHHLCAKGQSTAIVGQGHEAAATHFTAEAGGVYYFSVANSWAREVGGPAKVKLQPIDSDEGQLLMSKFLFSTSHPKK